MAFNLAWFKVTGLAAAQSAAHAVLAVIGGNVVDVLHLDYEQIAGVGVGAALVSVLGSIVAYQLPSGTPTAAVSLPAAALDSHGRHQAP